MFDPGDRWEYGINIDWAGRAVEKVSGQSLEVYFREHIFEPLGMTDTGFLIGLKGFVAAIVGGLAGYPAALAGALLVGQLEAFASFWASAFKEVLVFTLIIPVLWWRSLRSRHVEDEE